MRYGRRQDYAPGTVMAEFGTVAGVSKQQRRRSGNETHKSDERCNGRGWRFWRLPESLNEGNGSVQDSCGL